MRTTLNVPAELIDEAREAIGFSSKTDTVVFALREVVRRSRSEDLKRLIRRVDYAYDPTRLRAAERLAK